MIGILSLLFFSACSPNDRLEVDELNEWSYAYHYISLDSTQSYARRAYSLAGDSYDAGKAEALNNLAFVEIAKMRYDIADSLLRQTIEASENQVEMLVAEVQLMRLCQRMSANREFYECRERAIKRMQRINEERNSLSEHLLKRMIYAETDFAIINSTYYYYVGLDNQSANALFDIDPYGAILTDTAQYMNYLYNIGAGGIVHETTTTATRQKEMDYLYQCLTMAREQGSVYFEANAMMTLADLEDDADLAGNALMMFSEYGDIYQTAAAHRTLAACYRQEDMIDEAFRHLEEALSDSLIYQAPDLVASIHEQVALTYQAIGDTLEADYHKNLFTSVQEETRRDRYLEAQASLLDKSLHLLDMMIIAVVVAILILVFVLIVLYRLNKKQDKEFNSDVLLAPLVKWQEDNKRQFEILHERREDINEQYAVMKNMFDKEERLLMEHRARLAFVNSVTPFIDRILNEVNRISKTTDEGEATIRGRYEYIRELSDKIEEYNEVLTEWIQMNRGALNLRIESFALQDLFDVVSRGKTAFAMNGITLDVLPTDVKVKADRVLTLFMLNTMMDNAGKFTPAGGTVSIAAEQTETYVEVSVTDNGCGIPIERQSGIFSHTLQEGHGFGLVNCRGIIDKYRKTSRVFDVCTMAVESEVGKGSRFFFRLPKGVIGKMAVWLLALLPLASLYAADSLTWDAHTATEQIHEIVATRHQSDLTTDNQLAEYCRSRQQMQTDRTVAVVLLVLLLLFIIPAYYVVYYRHRLYFRFCVERVRSINDVLLSDMSLEEKLHQVDKLAKDDYPGTLKEVVENIQRTLCEAVGQFVFNRETTEMAEDELHRIEMECSNLHTGNQVLDNCFSTLKHETMYYPSRIRRLIDDENVNISDLKELIEYYRRLYFTLGIQALHELEHIKMPMSAIQLKDVLPSVEGTLAVIGNRAMLDYLMEILRKGLSKDDCDSVTAAQKDKSYVCITIPSAVERYDLFIPSKNNIPYLICRQIVREHAEAANRFGCGIVVKPQNGKHIIEITLPSSSYGQV